MMSAKVLELPARVRCDRAARELRESVIGVLKEIRRHCGDAAFHRAARDLVASVAAIVAQVSKAASACSMCSISSTAPLKPERRAAPPQML